MGVYSVFVGFCHSALQSFECVCVERGHVCIHKARFPSSPRSTQLFCLHCTLVWLFICKSQLLSSPDPILDLANSPVFIVWTSHEVVTTVQIMPRLHRIMDTCQVCEYLDSTMSKVLTILKWQMITTLNRNLLGYRTTLLPMRYT